MSALAKLNLEQAGQRVKSTRGRKGKDYKQLLEETKKKIAEIQPQIDSKKDKNGKSLTVKQIDNLKAQIASASARLEKR